MSDESTSSVAPGTEVTEASAPNETSAQTIAEMHGLTEVSEAELMGFDPEVTENTPATSGPTDEGKKLEGEEPKKEEVQAPNTQPPEDEVAPAKPPKGFVPTAALHEVRGENKYLKEQLSELQAKVASLATRAPEAPVAPVVKSEFDDFVELSDSEFSELAADSPADALLYMKKLGAFQKYEIDKAASEAAQADAEVYIGQVYSSANAEMEKAVPGIFTDETVAEEFRAFAEASGFTDDMFYLTNPATRIILPGESEPLLLGEQAAQIVKVLAHFKQASVAKADVVNTDQLKADLRKEIEAEVIAKLKTGETFKSLSSVPAPQDPRPEFGNKALSEKEFAKLSPAEQELYLSGE